MMIETIQKDVMVHLVVGGTNETGCCRSTEATDLAYALA
jgi:hypothetical protein